jgi:hypothetical protein
MTTLPPANDDGVVELHPDSPLRRAALEVEQHVAEGGWDQQPRLFALVPTADLVAREPALASQLGDGSDGSLTPIEQDGVPSDADFERALTHVTWPAEVAGCAAVIERLMLPPEVEDLTPEELGRHPDRQEVRLVAAVLRGGSSHSAVRRRDAGGRGVDSDLLEGPQLVPGLVALLDQTLAGDA